MNHVTHKLIFAEISLFFTGNQQIFLHQEIQAHVYFDI